MQKQRVLVTGGAGFIGSHLCEGLLAQGHDVLVIDNLATGKKENLPKNAQFHELDICDRGALDGLFDSEEFQAVFHLAAQNDVRTSVARPEFDARVNIIGGLNLLENCAEHGVSRFLFASTGGAIYGEAQQLPADESHPIRPEAPYGLTKYAFENYMRFFAEHRGLAVRALRLGNVYGPRQDPLGEAGVIAIFCGAMLSGRDCAIFGDGTQLRDYVYVQDVVEAFLKAYAAPPGPPVNIGTGKGISVNEIFEKLSEILDYRESAQYAPPRAGEIQRIYLDPSRAEEEIGWTPRTDFDEGLQKTADWFKKTHAS